MSVRSLKPAWAALDQCRPSASFPILAMMLLAWAGIRIQGHAAPAAPGTASAGKDNPSRQLFADHCVKCHSGEKPKGDFRIDQLTADFLQRTTRERWQTVQDKLDAGEMPPKSKPRPPEQEVRAVSQWIASQMAAADVVQRATQGRVVMRRLNREEYENTVRDLLGIKVKLKDMLPLDTAAAGFDNVGDALHTSSFLLDRYLEAADLALSQAIVNRPQPPQVLKRYRLTESHAVKAAQERVYRTRQDSSVVLFCSSPWDAVGLTPFYPSERGDYRFRISASAIQSAGRPVVFSVSSGSGGMGGAKAHVVDYFDAPADKAAVIEFVDHMEPKTSISVLPYALPEAETVNKIGADAYDGPGLVLDWIEVEGPLNATWPPESHRRIFGDLPQGPAADYRRHGRLEVVSKEPLADADRILRKFVRRAFRRTVTDDDVKPFTALVEAKMAEGQSFEQAVRVALSAVMVSPEFLFLREPPGKLDSFALASRLSYFLWSTMPDEELLTLAEQKKLDHPEILHAQVERMLQDPKAQAFTENFVGQWLGLRDIDFTAPSHLLYPEFDDMLKLSMMRETELFFAEVLKDNLGIANFISSDFSMLNGRLAKHYGIPGVEGWAFRKVALPPESHRGGLLTMASVLKVTANGTTTSPVTRGVWVLDRLLGTPPPHPPANVPALVPDTRGASTIREQLAKHREITSCANCHAKIDPPGFALESFDVIGGWRENYRSTGNGKQVIRDGQRMRYLQGKPVDCAGVLPDGRAFRNIDEFKQLLLTRKDQIARALTAKLLTYATGGVPESADRPEIGEIVGRIQDKNYGFRSLIHELVQSELFRNK